MSLSLLYLRGAELPALHAPFHANAPAGVPAAALAGLETLSRSVFRV